MHQLGGGGTDHREYDTAPHIDPSQSGIFGAIAGLGRLSGIELVERRLSAPKAE